MIGAAPVSEIQFPLLEPRLLNLAAGFVVLLCGDPWSSFRYRISWPPDDLVRSAWASHHLSWRSLSAPPKPQVASRASAAGRAFRSTGTLSFISTGLTAGFAPF